MTVSGLDALTRRLSTYVGDLPVNEFMTECVIEADALITGQVGGAVVPESVRDRAVIEVAAELFHRKSAPNGIKNFADGFDGAAAIRVARDALVAARPLLAPYLPLAIS